MLRGWPVRLQHGQVGLRPLQRRDAPTWSRLRAQNHAWLSQWEATLPPGNGVAPASYVALISSMRRKAARGQMMPFAITYEREMVGQLSVNQITFSSAMSASIGYWISRSHAGRQITPTAVALVTDHLLTTVGLHRIEIAIRPENAPSLRVVEKLGFVEYGMAPKFLHINGAWCDHRLFQMLAEDRPAAGLISRLV